MEDDRKTQDIALVFTCRFMCVQAHVHTQTHTTTIIAVHSPQMYSAKVFVYHHPLRSYWVPAVCWVIARTLGDPFSACCKQARPLLIQQMEHVRWTAFCMSGTAQGRSLSTSASGIHVGKHAGAFDECPHRARSLPLSFMGYLLDAVCVVSAGVLRVARKKKQRLEGAHQCWTRGLSCPGVPVSDSNGGLDVSGERVGSPGPPAPTTALPSIQSLSQKHISPAVSTVLRV